VSDFPRTAPLLPEILALHGRWRADRDAVIADGERIDWARFVADNHRFAHGLRAAGIATGDRVGVFMAMATRWSRRCSARWPPAPVPSP
jgi:acyl-CoA synthetase (AMP-forming)/AMP-acid ligase II